MTSRALILSFLLILATPVAGRAVEPAAGEASKTQAAASAAAKAEPLRIASWGGAYGVEASEIVFKPFTNRTGIEVEKVPYAGGLDGLNAPGGGEASGTGFDVVDFIGEDAAAACAAGLLTDIDMKSFAAGADQKPAAEDFVTRLPCAVAATLTSDVLIYDSSVSAARTPQHVTDIFDHETFPGKRGLKRDAMGNFELALLADGVAPKDVYTVLATADGIARAFAKLDEIKKMIVWWEKGDVPATLVGRGDVVMSTAYNTRAYAAAVNGAEITAVWDKAPVYVNGWGVLKSARDQKAALEFVKFATDSARLAQLGEAMPYGPARRSALQSISPEMRAFSPTAPEHLEKGFMIDADFWQKQGVGLRNRFQFWLAEEAKSARADTRAQASAPTASANPQP